MEEFKKLTDREHMLLRPAMYIGKTTPETITRFVNGIQEQVTISSGLLKIVNELIDNSIDEFIRSGGKFATKIDVTVDNNKITVKDNGRGIPVEKYQGEWRPQVAWTESKAGTSFSENRVGPGANGVGSVVANVFSKEFTGITCDGKSKCTVICSDNMQNIKTTVSKCTKRGTAVTIVPDYSRFGLTSFDSDHLKVLEDRIHLLAVTYPEIVFVFNGTTIKYKNAVEYFKLYGDPFVNWSGTNYVAAIFSSGGDDYIQKSSIDGLDLISGTHETVIVRNLSYSLRDLIQKRNKIQISPLEIKKCLKLVFIGRGFINLQFDSQTKERLTNSEKQIQEWLGEIDYNKIAKKIFSIKEIIEPIIQSKLAKQLAAENRAVTLALKKQNKKHIDGHIEAKSKNREEKTLFLCEGLSALGSLLKVRNPQKHGGFPLRGMPMNTYNVSDKTIIDNKELANIMAILNIKFNMSKKEIDSNLTYGKIGLLNDQDYDGTGGVAPLMLLFLYHWKELFEEGRVYLIQSPRYILTKGKGQKRRVIYFYDTKSFEQERDKYKGYEIRYIKGLGSLRPHEYFDVLNDESHWIQVTIDDSKCFEIMYANDSSPRKKLMNE